MFLQDWVAATLVSLQNVWMQVLEFLPKLIGALIVFVIGLMIASAVSHLVRKALEALKLNSVVEGAGVEKEFEKSGLRLDLTSFFTKLTYWFLLIVTLVLATNILFGEGTITTLLTPVFNFIPQVVAAIVILLGAVILANFVRTLVQAAILSAKLHIPRFLGNVAWWAIFVFGFIAALKQLGVGEFIVSIASTMITAAVFGAGLAFAIAFGFGCKDMAAGWLKKFTDQFGH